MIDDKPTGFITMKEYCERNGWPWPLPLPGTPEAEALIDKTMNTQAYRYPSDGYEPNP